jgi:lipopolysaccharide transport system permease protein
MTCASVHFWMLRKPPSPGRLSSDIMEATELPKARQIVPEGVLTAPSDQPTVRTIGVRKRSMDFSELWAYRELLFFLTWRDIKVRYKQTALGACWAVIQPLFLAGAFSLFFGRFAGLSSEGVPYTLFAYCGLLPWQLFSHTLNESSNSVVLNNTLITRVYFPRVIIPLSTVLTGLVDFSVGLLPLVVLMLYYHVVPSRAILVLPVFLLLALVAALGVGLWLSALNVRYRDVRYTVIFLTQLWLFLTPVAYSSTLVPSRWNWLFALNPMAGVVDGFRWSLLHTNPHVGLPIAVSATVALLLGATGLHYFTATQYTFADLI